MSFGRDSYPDDAESVRASYTPQLRHKLHEVLGYVESGDEGHTRVPIAPSKTNGDHWNEHDPAAVAILDQIEAACAERDEELAAYEKAEPKARAAQAESMRHWGKVRQANDRALKLREALDALKRVPR
jgi:hypothetical protein